MPYGWNQVIQNYMQSKQIRSAREQLDLQREALKQEKDKIKMAQERHDLDMDLAFSPIVQATTGKPATSEQIGEARKIGAVTVRGEETTRAAQPERPAPPAVRGGEPSGLTLPATKEEKVTTETTKPLEYRTTAAAGLTPEAVQRLSTQLEFVDVDVIADMVNSGLTAEQVYEEARLYNKHMVEMFEDEKEAEKIPFIAKIVSDTETRVRSEARSFFGTEPFGTEFSAQTKRQFQNDLEKIYRKILAKRQYDFVGDPAYTEAEQRAIILRLDGSTKMREKYAEELDALRTPPELPKGATEAQISKAHRKRIARENELLVELKNTYGIDAWTDTERFTAFVNILLGG